MWFPSDGSEEWLSKSDAEMAVRMAAALSDECRVAEIGVWKGAWSSVILMNLEKSNVIGIDPYPQCEDEKLIMTNRMLELGASKRFTLYDSLDELPKESLFHFVHVDGLHTEKQVMSDLAKVSEMLAVGGVIAVDDFTSPWFPGIQSAMYRFILENDYRIFLVSMQKAYITRTDNAPVLWQLIKDMKDDFEFCEIYENAADMYPDHRLLQETDVLGQPVLVSSPRWEVKNGFGARLRRFLGSLLNR
jgi:predicted O-methyltransferase YrrM